MNYFVSMMAHDHVPQPHQFHKTKTQQAQHNAAEGQSHNQLHQSTSEAGLQAEKGL